MSEIRVNQTLHGYDGGHSLLAASEHLPYSSESDLFVLSDLSGSSLVSGFDEYLTGYPLSDVAAYAFARTWYADEMERPGCVWTHTLVISNSDLAVLQDCSVLLKSFRRPTRDAESWAEYEQKLTLNTDPSQLYDNGIGGHYLTEDRTLVETLRGLYEVPEAPVCLPARSSKTHESFVVALWSQQWPRLRRSFRFCTGAMENRTLKGRSFDLQVIPHQTISRFQRDIQNCVIVGEMSQTTAVPDWVRTLTSDLKAGDTELREFFRNFGVDVTAKRSAMQRLCRAFRLLLEEENSFPDRVDALFEIFPSAGEAIRLKLAVLTGVEGEIGGRAIPASPSERMHVLISTTHDASFPKKVFDDANIDILIEKEGVYGTLAYVVSTPHLNSFGESIVRRIAQNFAPSDIESTRATPSVLLLLTSRNPMLATHPELWRALRDHSHQLVDLLAAAHLTSADWDSIIRATIVAEVPNIAEPLVRSVGSVALISVLEVMQSSSCNIPLDWHQQIERHSTAVAEWLRAKPRIADSILRVLTEDLNPYDASVVGIGAGIWDPLLESKSGLAIRTATFLLVLGFQNPAGTPFTMVAEVFGIVHRAAEHNALEQRSWQLLRDILPSLGFFHDWDVCERLRRLLIGKFIMYGWPLYAFVNALHDPDAFDRALYHIASEKHLRPFGRKLVTEARSGVFRLSYTQQSILDKYSRKFGK